MYVQIPQVSKHVEPVELPPPVPEAQPEPPLFSQEWFKAVIENNTNLYREAHEKQLKLQGALELLQAMYGLVKNQEYSHDTSSASQPSP